MPTDIRVAWWNLENLFDSSGAQRDPELAAQLKGELKGWTVQVRDRKLDQLASIVKLMFAGDGPDILGVCEVENERVVQMLADRLNLVGRNYQVLGHASPDARGIDVSFIFDGNVLTATNSGHQVVVKRTGTRDIFWSTITVAVTGDSFVAVANHWPARSEGQYESEPYRMLTGETLSFVLATLLDEDADLPVLVMGDFNDEPHNRAMQEYLLGSNDPNQVRNARTPRVLNLMWSMLGANEPGTFRFGSTWNMLDQFLVTKGALRQASKLKVDRSSVSIFRPSVMRGSGGAPRRFGRPAKKLDTDGYSDHFPITVELRVS